MAHIVKQRCSTRGGTVVRVQLMLLAQAVQHTTHQMKGAQRMREARMFGALVGIQSETELLDAPETLKFHRVD
jgi:hypothetical protein